MSTEIQILLINIALTLTTLLLVALGIHLILVLREIRRTIRKIYFVLESFEKAGVNAKEGLEEIAGFINGVRTALKLASKVKKGKIKNG